MGIGESALHTNVTDEGVPAFAFASTLRQMREVWEIHREGAARAALLQLLEVRLAQLRNATLEMRPDHVRAMRQAAEPTGGVRRDMECVRASSSRLSV
jgi:hypothetical protein